MPATGQDQVLRMRCLLNVYPHVSVRHVRYPAWEYVATWYDKGERNELRAAELSWLLDDLEEKLAAEA